MIRIGKVGLGTAQFGLDYGISNQIGQTSYGEVKNILIYAEQMGIDTLDTAGAYGDSEMILGKIGHNNFNVVTKFIANNPLDLFKVFNKSLIKLNTNNIYGLLSHNIEQIKNNPALWDSMLQLKQEEKVEKIGFSFNSTSEIEYILRFNIIPDIIQIPFSILDNRFIDIAEYFKKNGTIVHSRSSFLQGLFFCNPDKLNDYFNPLKTFVKELQHCSDNLAADLLNHCLKIQFIDKVIVGVNSASQLADISINLKYAKNINIPVPELDETILTPSNWII